MIKFLKNISALLLLIVSYSLGAAPSVIPETGLFFSVNSLGIPQVNVTLCLIGDWPITCQEYVTSTRFEVLTKTPNFTYKKAAVKINTPGYIIEDMGRICKPGCHDLCILTLNDKIPKIISLAYEGGISLYPNTLPAANKNIAYNQQITAQGGVEPYQYQTSGSLQWLSFNPTTGILSGTPGTSDTNVTFTITVVDARGVSFSQQYTVEVAAQICLATYNSPSFQVTGPGGFYMLQAELSSLGYVEGPSETTHICFIEVPQGTTDCTNLNLAPNDIFNSTISFASIPALITTPTPLPTACYMLCNSSYTQCTQALVGPET
jgi:hypothetical protein